MRHTTQHKSLGPKSGPTGGSSKRFPVVCIGFSAGGVEPLQTIFRQLSPHTGMAFVIVAHVSRSDPTLLPYLLARWSKMPAEVASSGLVLKPNHIYTIPPGKEITIKDGYFDVRPRSKVFGWPNVITLFLNSLAAWSKPPGIAVILSGLGDDGAAALRGFESNGGVTIAQDLRSAKFQDMPLSAINTGFIRYVLSPEGIVNKLESIAVDYRKTYVGHSAAEASDRSSQMRRNRPKVCAEPIARQGRRLI